MIVKWPTGVDREIPDADYEILRRKLDRGDAPPIPAGWPKSKGEEERWIREIRTAFGLRPGPCCTTLADMLETTCAADGVPHRWGDETFRIRVPGTREHPVGGSKLCTCVLQARMLRKLVRTWEMMDGCPRIELGTPLADYVDKSLIVVGDHPRVAAHVRKAMLSGGHHAADWRVVTLPELREAARPRSFDKEGEYEEASGDADETDDRGAALAPGLFTLAASPDLLIVLGDATLLKQRKIGEVFAETLAARAGRKRLPTWVVVSAKGLPAFSEAAGFPVVTL